MKTPFNTDSSGEESSTVSTDTFPYGSRFLEMLACQFATLAIIMVTLIHYIKNFQFYDAREATILMGFYVVSLTALWKIAHYISHKEWSRIFPPYVVFFCAMFFKFLVFLNPPSEVELVHGLRGIDYFAFHDGLSLLIVVLWSAMALLSKSIAGKLSSLSDFGNTMKE